ncbi:MAG: hypothetical protein J3K34DRAFT_524758 [Monoraphidium minutum]|nr:MAG: hypothetical protein J3K34DRAFT_524758 [Monoraphidium minutum]
MDAPTAAATPMSAALNAAQNPDGSGAATVGLTHSPHIDATAGAAASSLGLPRVLTPISAGLLDLIVLDHNRLRALYDCYVRLGPVMAPEQRQMLAWAMISCMSEHAGKEELVLYPAIRRVLGDCLTVFGDIEADKCLNEHAQARGLWCGVVKLLTAQLDTMVASDPSFDLALRSGMEQMLAHITEEEGDLLPRLGAALTPLSMLELGIKFEAAKAPNLPPFNKSSLAAARQVDTALDQARMPSVVPAVVTLNPPPGAATGATAMPGVQGAECAEAGGGGVGVTRADVTRQGGAARDQRGGAAAPGAADVMSKVAPAPGGEMEDIVTEEVDVA